jgi:uncharacterized protein (TIGR00296 family)
MELPPDLCFVAFEALMNSLTKSTDGRVLKYARSLEKGPMWANAPVIVSWRLDGHSRGCMGCFTPVQVLDGVAQYAVLAAGHDRRHKPISLADVTSLECVVTILHSFEAARNAFDWTLGIHGIRLVVDHCLATIRPEIPEMNKWTKEETLARVAKQAGFEGEYDIEAITRTSIERFQAKRGTATWGEYQKFLRRLG